MYVNSYIATALANILFLTLIYDLDFVAVVTKSETTLRLVIVHVCMKFCSIILNGSEVMGGPREVDGRTNRRWRLYQNMSAFRRTYKNRSRTCRRRRIGFSWWLDLQRRLYWSRNFIFCKSTISEQNFSSVDFQNKSTVCKRWGVRSNLGALRRFHHFLHLQVQHFLRHSQHHHTCNLPRLLQG